MHSLCTKLYYLAKNAVAVYRVIVNAARVSIQHFLNCLPYTYTILYDEIFEPEFPLVKRKISPAVISQRMTVNREISLAVILCVNILFNH